MSKVPAIWLPSRTPFSAICFSSRRHRLLVGEGAEDARLAVVEQGVEQRDRADPVVALLGEVGRQHGGQRAAEAQADDVDLGRAGDLGDDVERFPRAVDEVIVERHAAHGGVRVAVGDREHGPLVLYRPLQEAAAGRQVHDVVLVDPRRAGQHRDRTDLGRLRRVLDELHQVVLEHDLARGGGEVFADPERPGVDLARPAAVVEHVVDEVAGPGDQAGPAGLKRPLERGRIGQQEVRRRERVHQEAGRERGLGVVHGVPRPGLEQVVDQPRRGQVRLTDGEEGRIVGPRPVREPLVALRDGDRRRRLHAHPAGRGDRPGHRDASPVAQRSGRRGGRFSGGAPHHRERRSCPAPPHPPRRAHRHRGPAPLRLIPRLATPFPVRS